MSGLTQAISARGLPPKHARRTWQGVKQFVDDPGVLVAAGLLCLVGVLVAFGPLLAPHDPTAVSLSDANAGSSATHLLGTDASGRDILSRLIAGARSSVLGPAVVALVATVLGATIAVVAAWRGGTFDVVNSRALDVMFAFPGLLLAILAAAIFGTGLVAPIAALIIVNTPYVARIVRSAALKERNLPYIAACELQGMSSRSVVLRHLLPNIQRIIWAQAALVFSYSIVDIAAINFLGLGSQPPSSDWGLMVAEGQGAILRGQPQAALAASAMIVLLIVSVNVLATRIDPDRETPVAVAP